MSQPEIIALYQLAVIDSEIDRYVYTPVATGGRVPGHETHRSAVVLQDPPSIFKYSRLTPACQTVANSSSVLPSSSSSSNALQKRRKTPRGDGTEFND